MPDQPCLPYLTLAELADYRLLRRKGGLSRAEALRAMGREDLIPLGQSICYPPGKARRGYSLSPETKAKIATSLRGKPRPASVRNQISRTLREGKPE